TVRRAVRQMVDPRAGKDPRRQSGRDHGSAGQAEQGQGLGSRRELQRLYEAAFQAGIAEEAGAEVQGGEIGDQGEGGEAGEEGCEGRAEEVEEEVTVAGFRPLHHYVVPLPREWGRNRAGASSSSPAKRGRET